MKKEDLMTYILIWCAIVGICLYLVGTGIPFSIYAKESNRQVQEDTLLYEKLLEENNYQTEALIQQESQAAQKKQTEQSDSSLTESDDKSYQDQDADKSQQASQDLWQHSAQDNQQSEETSASVRQQVQSIFSQAEDQLAGGSVVSQYFIVDPNTSLAESQVPAEELLEMDHRMQSEASNPQILIYHTHSQEGYADSVPGDPATSVVGLGEYLAELLTTRYGYHVLHVEDTYDLVDGQLDRNGAYTQAREGIAQVLEQNPSIEVIIDLHRDGVDESKRLVTEIDGKSTAQIMFFNGLSKTNDRGTLTSLPNPYIQDNLSFSLQLSVLADSLYEQFCRGIYVKGYRYNLHFRPKSILLEVGAQTNTVQEARNAMEPFADILDKVLKGT